MTLGGSWEAVGDACGVVVVGCGLVSVVLVGVVDVGRTGSIGAEGDTGRVVSIGLVVEGCSVCSIGVVVVGIVGAVVVGIVDVVVVVGGPGAGDGRESHSSKAKSC